MFRLNLPLLVCLAFASFFENSEQKTCLDGSSSQMKTRCKGPFDHCDADWQMTHEVVPHAVPQCFCVRPFNAQEREEIRTCKCDNFLDQCLHQRGMLYSCGRATQECSQERLKKECANKIANNDKEYQTLCSFEARG